MPPPCSSRGRVLVVGGGTAGFLAALTVKAFHPSASVAILESKQVPVIGVGESTTSEMVPFLHRVLHVEIAEFYRRVLPTWKLGIKFIWGPPDSSFFMYPFDRGPLLESLAYQEHIRACSLWSSLMARDSGPVLAAAGANVVVLALLADRPFGYHLDNKRLLTFLRDVAARRDVPVLEGHVADIVLDDDRTTVRRLVTSDGAICDYDFYIDATGFASLLLGRALGSRFLSYQSSLYTDRAVVANVPHADHIKPYTTARTMGAGWCWNIPQVEEDHVGYVYSSRHLAEDAAAAELTSLYPTAHDLWSLKFASGRRAAFISGNVAGVGNAYGFVEPLESTALFVLCRQAVLLAVYLGDVMGGDAGRVRRLNAYMGSLWDYIRWFLSIHYRYNTRSDTAFWQECRASVDITGAAPIVGRFRLDGPLSYLPESVTGIEGPNFDRFGYDVLLMGQGLSPGRLEPRLSSAEFEGYLEGVEAIERHSMPTSEALRLFHDRGADQLQVSLESSPWMTRLSTDLLNLARHAGTTTMQ